MYKKDWLLKWRTGTICIAVAVGLLGIVIANEEKHAVPYGYRQDKHSQIDLSQRFTSSWNRDGLFRAAYMRALKDTSDSFGLNDFVALGHDPLLETGGAKKAIDAYQHVISVTPDEDGALNDLAWLYAISGDLKAAISTEQRAISLYKYDYTSYILLGVFYERSGRMDEAQSAYAQSLVLYPRLIKSGFWHSLQLRRPILADAAVQNAFKLIDTEQPDYDDLKRMEVKARLAAENGFLNEAGILADSLSDRLSSLSGMWELQGELLEGKGNNSEALLDYQRAIFLDREDPLPHERLAEAELMASEAEKARSEALIAWGLTRQPQSPLNERRSVQYQHNYGRFSGVLPVTLLRETQPSFEFESFFSRLSSLFASRHERDRANEMRHMADMASSRSTLYGDLDSDQ